MNAVSELARRNLGVIVAWVIALALFLLGTALYPEFAAPNHVRTLLLTASFIGFAGVGQTLCILTGGIDLSMPSVISGSAVLAAYLSSSPGANLGVTLLIILVVAAVIGTINGVAIAYTKVPPIIITLGMNGALLGLLLVYTNGGVAAQTPAPILDFVGGSVAGTSPTLWLWLIVSLGAIFVLGWTSFGRQLYAVGTNATAATLAGVNANRVIVTCYVVSSVFAAITGFLVLGFLGQAFVNMGDDYLFSSAIAVAIGGASILGGKGNYAGTVAGALILALVGAILPMLSLGTSALRIAYGAILLLTIVLGRLEAAGR